LKGLAKSRTFKLGTASKAYVVIEVTGAIIVVKFGEL